MTIYIPPGTPAEEADCLIAEAFAQARKRRRKRPAPVELPVAPPCAAGATTTLYEGRAVMSVPLMGDIARGRRFVLDLLAWDRVKLLAGDGWTLMERGARGTPYVVSYRRQAADMGDRRDGTAPNLRLARFVARATPGQVVTYRNGDSLDLTGRNLVLEDRGEHWDRHRLVPLDSRTPTGVE